MTFYVILTTFFFIVGLLEICIPINKDAKKIILLFLFFIALLFKGLRWDTGTDWPQYFACFEESSWSNILSYTRYGSGTQLMEFGYVFLNVLIKTFTGHYTFFLLITNGFILYSFYRIFKLFLPDYFILTLALSLIALDWFPVRQSIAISIFYLGIPYIIKCDFKKYLIICFLCFTIHRSSLLFLVFYPILRFKFSYKWSVITYLILSFSAIYIVKAFDLLHNAPLINALTGGIMDQYDAAGDYDYKGQYEEVDSKMMTTTYISSFVQLSLFAYPYYRFRFNTDKEKYSYGFVLNMYFIYLILNLIGRIPGFIMVFRFSNALIICYPLIIGMSCYYFAKNRLKLLSVVIFTGAFFIKVGNQPAFNPEHEYYDLFVPYKTFLQQDERPREGFWRYHQKK